MALRQTNDSILASKPQGGELAVSIEPKPFQRVPVLTCPIRVIGIAETDQRCRLDAQIEAGAYDGVSPLVGVDRTHGHGVLLRTDTCSKLIKAGSAPRNDP